MSTIGGGEGEGVCVCVCVCVWWGGGGGGVFVRLSPRWRWRGWFSSCTLGYSQYDGTRSFTGLISIIIIISSKCGCRSSISGSILVNIITTIVIISVVTILYFHIIYINFSIILSFKSCIFAVPVYCDNSKAGFKHPRLLDLIFIDFISICLSAKDCYEYHVTYCNKILLFTEPRQYIPK